MTRHPDRIRVLVAEDSPVARDLLCHLLSEDPRLEVIGVASDGAEAVREAIRQRPDLVVMDVHMPGMDGVEATREIMERAPLPIILVSAVSGPESVAAFDGLKAGALALVDKPVGPGHPSFRRHAGELVERVKLMAEVRVVRRWAARRPPAPPKSVVPAVRRRIRVVAIGASTGGPQTVAEILTRLPATLPVPILYIQHITRGFTAGLVEWLRRQTKLKVKVVDAGEPLLPGVVYIGPEGLQMGLNGDLRARLAPPGGDDAFCPSVSHLLASVVEAVGGEAMGVLLTGMGRDGVSELRLLRERGGITIAQNEKSSVVYGMPGVAVREGAAEHVLAPAQIAQSIAALAGTTGERGE